MYRGLLYVLLVSRWHWKFRYASTPSPVASIYADSTDSLTRARYSEMHGSSQKG
jgi:hypothetical protein